MGDLSVVTGSKDTTGQFSIVVGGDLELRFCEIPSNPTEVELTLAEGDMTNEKNEAFFVELTKLGYTDMYFRVTKGTKVSRHGVLDERQEKFPSNLSTYTIDLTPFGEQ